MLVRVVSTVCDFLRVLYNFVYMKISWQSCTGDAAPRVVNMHGVRVVYRYEEGDLSVCHTDRVGFTVQAKIGALKI